MGLFSLILIGATLGFAFYAWKKSKKSTKGLELTPKRAFSKEDLRLENVGPGGVIGLRHIGSEMEDFDIKVKALNIYRQGTTSWYEIEGDRGGETVFLEYEEDDELEISITLKNIKLRDLGISKKNLEKIDDDEEGQCAYEGETFFYEDSDTAIFYKNGDDSEAESFYYWDFEAKDEKHFIGVEKWSDGEFKISYSEAVKASQLTIYSLK